MRKFTTGLITGGVLGALGLTLALSDRGTRNKVVRSGRKAMNSAADAMDDVKSKVW